MSRAALALAVLATSTIACTAPRVRLDAPPADAAPQARLDAYSALRPKIVQQTHTTHIEGSRVVGTSVTTDFMLLASGRRVYHPADLLPAVPGTSVTAEAIGAFDQHSRLSGYYGLASWVFMGVSVYGVLAYSRASADVEFDEEPDVAFELGTMVTGLAGWGITYLVANYYARQAQDDKVTAFGIYESDLRKRLNLCVAEDKVGPCEALETQPEAPEMPDATMTRYAP